ncbi:MAG: CAP domain-containing protein [Smithella sp.]|nr:CAP domain-containing protein [Smithella sp.]
MTGFNPSPFWKKHGVVLAAIAVIFAVLLITNMKNLSEVYNNVSDHPGYFSVKQVRSSGKSLLMPVPREVLNKEGVIELTNKERVNYGLTYLEENHLLNIIAASRAQDMLEKQYFAHVSPIGEQASDIARTVGYAYKIIAENIGSGDFLTNQKIVDGWMQSPGHRNNILSTEVREIGAAVARGKMHGRDTFVTVQIFGLPSPPVKQKVCVAPSEKHLHDIEVKKAEIESLQSQIVRLKNELEAEQESIERDRKYIYNDAEKARNLNESINVFNEKSRWYNRLVGEAKAKAVVAESMVNEYNRVLQTYNECSAAYEGDSEINETK